MADHSYAHYAEDFLRAEPVKSDAGKSYIAHYPLGAVLAVMPWNFPFWQVFRAAAPALMAGIALSKLRTILHRRQTLHSRATNRG